LKTQIPNFSIHHELPFARASLADDESDGLAALWASPGIGAAIGVAIDSLINRATSKEDA
jgi:hypothetical protein